MTVEQVGVGPGGRAGLCGVKAGLDSRSAGEIERASEGNTTAVRGAEEARAELNQLLLAAEAWNEYMFALKIWAGGVLPAARFMRRYWAGDRLRRKKDVPTRISSGYSVTSSDEGQELRSIIEIGDPATNSQVSSL